MNTDIPLVQAGFFKPILDTLDAAGASTARLLHGATLHRFDLSNTENYVPVELMYRLLEEIERREGIDDFVEVFAHQINVQSMCDWTETIACSPDCLSAINFSTEYEDVVLTHQRIRLEIDGPVSKYSWLYLDQPQYLERPYRGREYTDYADTCLAINFFKQVAEPGWAPLELHLQSFVAPNLDWLLPTGNNTKIYLGQPASAIVFPTAMLSVPLLNDGTDNPSVAFDDTPQNLSGTIEKLLSSACNGQIANLELMADILDQSPRTLRRRLVAEGTTFSEIVDGWRFKSSIDLLEQSNARVQEISDRLGYANAPNFERAFKRWTGQTPGAYRDALTA